MRILGEEGGLNVTLVECTFLAYVYIPMKKVEERVEMRLGINRPDSKGPKPCLKW
jgi:hypothetical protein